MTEKQWRAWLKIKLEAAAHRVVNKQGGSKYYKTVPFMLSDIRNILVEAQNRAQTIKR